VTKKLCAIIICLLLTFLGGCASTTSSAKSNTNTLTKSFIIFEFTKVNVTNEEASSIMDILGTRFKDLGFKSITIERVGDNQIKAELSPASPNINTIADIVCKPNRFKVTGPNQETILTEKDIKSAKVDEEQTYKQFDLELQPDGSKKLADATQTLIGKKVNIFLDDRQMADLVVVEPITRGAIAVPVSSSIDEAKIIAAVLNSGKILPFQLKVMEVTQIQGL
jgi:preprotein translocase subunit SecD